MSYAAHRNDFGTVANQKASPKAVASMRGVLRRFLDTIMESRQRDTDRQIARFLAARSGGVLTDNLEREMVHRVVTSNWSLSRDPFNTPRFP